MSGDPDQELMRRFQEGDDAAFEVLVHKYQGMVLSLCRRYLGSRFAGVEDVAQQVFVRIYRGKRNYEPRAKVKTWIFQVGVNACLNEIRSLRARKNRGVVPFTAVFGPDGEGGDTLLGDPRAAAGGDGIEADEVAARVRAAVDRLPEQQRLAVVLSRFHQMGYAEVAEAMGTTVAAVKSLLSRAREHLRVDLADLAGPSAPPE
jgi:RNA polymerase sigma-70 factor (ECF subfamily)